MSEIFISYASAEPSRAAMLAQILEGYGWSVFWDRTIEPGTVWRRTIKRELDQARCVIVLWTKASIQSDWVHEEAAVAKRRRILVPILIENVEPPLGFGSIQAARFIDWDGTSSTSMFQSLIETVATLVGRPPTEGQENGHLGIMSFLLDNYVEDNDVEARKRYEIAAAKGHTDAMCRLGTLYSFGRGGPRNEVKARLLFEKAAALGNADAMRILGSRYDHWEFGGDHAKAREWYEKAAMSGNVGGMYALGALYRQGGRNVAQDLLKAHYWLEKAAATRGPPWDGMARGLLNVPIR